MSTVTSPLVPVFSPRSTSAMDFLLNIALNILKIRLIIGYRFSESIWSEPIVGKLRPNLAVDRRAPAELKIESSAFECGS